MKIKLVREWLQPAPNNLYFIGIGNTPLWIIDGDKLELIKSAIPIIWPFRVIPIRLVWQQWLADGSKLTEKVDSTIGHNKSDELKFKNPVKIPGEDNGYIVTRDEYVKSLRKIEFASYRVDIESNDGYNLHMIVTFMMDVFDGLKAFKRPLFKTVGQHALDTILEPWGFANSLVQIKDTNVDLIKDKDCGITIKYNGENVDLVTYINKMHLESLGVRIETPFLKILEGPDVQELFALRKEESKQEQRTNNTIAYGKTRAQQRLIEKEDADQETNIAKERIKELYTASYSAMMLGYLGQAHVEKQRPNVIFEVRSGNDPSPVDIFLKGMAEIMPKSNETASREKFKKEA